MIYYFEGPFVFSFFYQICKNSFYIKHIICTADIVFHI